MGSRSGFVEVNSTDASSKASVFLFLNTCEFFLSTNSAFSFTRKNTDLSITEKKQNKANKDSLFLYAPNRGKKNAHHHAVLVALETVTFEITLYNPLEFVLEVLVSLR